jgi:hypothetical protein
MAVFPFCIFKLQMHRIPKHQVQQGVTGTGQVDMPHETFFSQLGQPSAVVKMGMGQDNRINGGRIEREIFRILLFRRFGALE